MKRQLALILHGWALKLEPGIALAVETVVEALVQARVQAAVEEYDRRLAEQIARHQENVARFARSN